jgi:ribonucleoside-diphosphate reductase alpha chain|tara:strand:+ start:12089 stop:13825 length:1737 start_codon:yes stop_codon:yes gene_type:complete
MIEKFVSIYKELGRERKRLQAEGRIPEWYTTPGWQMFKEKYKTDDEPDVRSTFERIAKCASKHMVGYEDEWNEKFFNLMWNGYLAPSTPVMANMGTTRGMPVSCSGSFIGDSVLDFYDGQKESALLSKNGFGTSSYLGAIRERGTPISTGGTASGVVPVFKDFVQMSRDVSQGSTRRGSWAGYIPIESGDFWEMCNHIIALPDDVNVGWNVSDDFTARLDAGDEDAVARYQKALKVKMLTGKGYYFFVDKVNRLSPPMYTDRGLKVYASNLCTEITLNASSSEAGTGFDDVTFTCVLSSVNLSKYDEMPDPELVMFESTIFLDCVASEFIAEGKKIKGLEKAVRFTEKGRALGLGTLGWHTYLQQKNVAFESMEAHMINNSIFKQLNIASERASRWLAERYGEPEWCVGYGLRNTHRIAIAPNLSSAILCGSVSQGIEPVYKNAYVQRTSAGEVDRINPVLIKVMKEKGVFNPKTINGIIDENGSVQHVEWLDDQQKMVFRTAFEINQEVIIRLASARQRHIDQAQSINLFFSADESEEVISRIHEIAFKDPYIKSLYYIRSESGVKAASSECVACEG